MWSLRHFAVVVIVLFLATRSWGAEPTTRPSADKEIRALTAKIAELEQRNRELELKLRHKELEMRMLQQQMRLSITRPIPFGDNLMIRPPAAVPQVPKGWVPQQFNGVTHYLIPLQNGGSCIGPNDPAQ
jgi:hypothetical protein